MDAAALLEPSDTPNPVLNLLKPSITLEDSEGRELEHVAPYGEPPEWGVYVVGVTLAVLATVVVASLLYVGSK